MPVRHVLLGTLALAVLGATVYLFLEVRASPAAPQPRQVVAKSDDRRTGGGGDEDDAPPPSKPDRSDRSGRNTRVTRGPTGSANPNTETKAPDVPDASANLKLDDLMAEANKAFDRADFDEAKTIANKVLRTSPGNARMLRILVTTACIDHDQGEAQKHYNLLTAKSDRDAMRLRCQRDYSIILVEHPLKK